MKKVSNSRSNSSKTSDKPRGKKSDSVSKGDKKPRKFEERGDKDDKNHVNLTAEDQKRSADPVALTIGNRPASMMALIGKMTA